MRECNFTNIFYYECLTLQKKYKVKSSAKVREIDKKKSNFRNNGNETISIVQVQVMMMMPSTKKATCLNVRQMDQK